MLSPPVLKSLETCPAAHPETDVHGYLKKCSPCVYSRVWWACRSCSCAKRRTRVTTKASTSSVTTDRRRKCSSSCVERSSTGSSAWRRFRTPLRTALLTVCSPAHRGIF